MLNTGASIFGLPVPDPEKFGVIELDQNDKIIDIVEKPAVPKSNLIIPGMYFFDSNASSYTKTLKPSPRGELEITDLIKIYLNMQNLSLQRLDETIVWHDTGNAEALLSASQKVRQFEKDHHIKLGSYEIASFEMGFITAMELEKIADKFIKSDYGQAIKNYLLKI